MHQTTTSLITQVESIIHQPSPQIERLNQLKNEIMQKMEHIEVLNGVYKEKTQLTFLNTFKNIMNQLSDQLKNAVQAYQNIDHEISQDQKCLLLSRQTQFFRNEKFSMQQTYQMELDKLYEVKTRNIELKRKRNQLKAKSILRQQKLSFYQTKNRSLSLRLNQSIQHSNKEKKLTQSTKYPTSGQRTRLVTYSSQKRKPFFENSETENKVPEFNQFYRSKNNKKNNITSQTSSRVKVNSFLL